MKEGFDCVGVGAGALIINDKNEALLLKRTNKTRNLTGFWMQPGGGVEFNEKIEDAVKREIKEETGFNFEPKNILGIYSLSKTSHIESSDL